MKFIKSLIIALLCVLTPVFLYVITPEIESESIDLINTKVAIVNDDEGIYKGEEYYNFASNMINRFMKETEFNTITTSSSDAFNMLEDGDLMYVIVFDKEFSKNVDGFKLDNPTQGTVQYYYNHTYNSADGNIISENERDSAFAQLQKELSTVYTKTIVSELQSSKDMLTEDIEEDVNLVAEIKTTSENNTSVLNEKIESNSDLLTTFENTMDDNISTVNESIDQSNTDVRELILQAQASITNANSTTETELSNRENIKSILTANKSKYEKSSDLMLGEEGLTTVLTQYYIPALDSYDRQYSGNSKVISSVVADLPLLDNVCNDIETSNDYLALTKYMKELKLSKYDRATQSLVEVDVFTDTEIETIISDAYTACSQSKTNDIIEYNLGNTDNLNILYNNIKNQYINSLEPGYEFINEVTATTIELGSEVGSSAVDPTDGYQLLTTEEIETYNNVRKLLAFMSGSDEPTYLTVDDTSYVTDSDYALLKDIVINVTDEYTAIGGVLDLTVFTNLSYAKMYLPAEAGTALSALENEYSDTDKELEIAADKATAEFNAKLQASVFKKVVLKSISVSSKDSMTDIVAELKTEANTTINLTTEALNAYQTQYALNLEKLDANSNLIVTNLEESEEMSLRIIEHGEMMLDANDVISLQNADVALSNTQINELFSKYVESNQETIEITQTNAEIYKESVSKLEDANETQKTFVEDYATVLENANVDGVNNNNFYSFITNPISFERFEVNEDSDESGSYFLLLWFLVGLVFISLLKDNKNKYLELNIQTNSFSENILVRAVNKYLLTVSLLLAYMMLFSIILINRFLIVSPILFTMRFIVLSTLVFASIRIVASKYPKLGYGITFAYAAVMYVAIYSENLPSVLKVVLSPITSVNNFIVNDVYKVSQPNAFIYCLIVYVALFIIALLIHFIPFKKIVGAK